MSFGTFQVAGVQTGTPSANQISLGPFALPFGPVGEVIPTLVNTTATVPIPATALGLAIIPPVGNTTPYIQMSLVSSANASAGNYISPGTPTIVELDPLHMPANLYLVSGGSVTVVVQIL